MCLGAENMDGNLLCNCHLPATGQKAAPAAGKVEAMTAEQTAKATEVLVDELVRTAVAATAEAPNRAVKRRVRQRLHKKLGAVLNKQEFDVAMERFHAAAEAHRDEVAHTQRKGPVNRAPIGAPPARPPQASPSQVVAVPVWMVQQVGASVGPVGGPAPPGPRMAQVQMPQMPQMATRWNCGGMTVCAVQDVRQFQERVQVPEMAPCQQVPYMNKMYVGQQDALGLNQGFGFQRAVSEGAGCESTQSTGQPNLPVQRTFIQFNDQEGSQRRSRSQ